MAPKSKSSASSKSRYHSANLKGSYWQSKPPPTQIRCKGYTAPPFDGVECGIMDKGTFFGPVEEWVEHRGYLTVLVHGWWVSVQLGNVEFAYRVPDYEVSCWIQCGWECR